MPFLKIAAAVVIMAAFWSIRQRQAAAGESNVAAPTIVAPWRRIITYPDNHLNDFCLFRALDGRWHCLGIMGTGTWSSERSFFHCSSPALHGPYEQHPPLLVELKRGETKNAAPQKHAPFVVLREKTCYLFFRRPPGTNLLLKSDDLFHWPLEPKVMFEENDARDACIQRFDGEYFWYYCQYRSIGGVGRSCIRLRRSQDLETWNKPVDVHVDQSRTVKHSHLESPFVIQAEGAYWLFVRNRSLDERCVTTVFRSDRPDRFRSGVRAWDAELEQAHAPELVFDEGKWHLARVSGPPDHLSHAPRRGGWIDLAPLSFGKNKE